MRGFIGYHPLPVITKITTLGSNLSIEWDGPSSTISNLVTHTSASLHRYVVERATHLAPSDFAPVSDPTPQRNVTINNCCPDQAAFYRLKVLPPGAASNQP